MFCIVFVLAFWTTTAIGEQIEAHASNNQSNSETLLQNQNIKLNNLENDFRSIQKVMNDRHPNPLVGTMILGPIVAGLVGNGCEKIEPSAGAAVLFAAFTLLGIISCYKALDGNLKEKQKVILPKVDSYVAMLRNRLTNEKLEETPRGKELLIELDKASSQCRERIKSLRPKKKSI